MGKVMGIGEVDYVYSEQKDNVESAKAMRGFVTESKKLILQGHDMEAWELFQKLGNPKALNIEDAAFENTLDILDDVRQNRRAILILRTAPLKTAQP